MRWHWCHKVQLKEWKMKKKCCWRCFWLDDRSLEVSYIWKDFHTFYEWRSFWQVEEQTWHDFGQKYKVHETQVMEGSSTFCVLPLSWIAWEQAVLNQDLEGLGRKKEWGMYASMPDTITSVMRSEHRVSVRTQVSVTEAIIIPRKISIHLQVSPTSRGKTQKSPPLWRILRRNRRDRTRYRYEIVIGGTQRRRKCDSISRRNRG